MAERPRRASRRRRSRARHRRRQRRERKVRARVRRALVHLTPERLHQKFLAEVRTLPREMARDALLKRLVRVREFGKRVVRARSDSASSPPAPSPSSKDATAVERHRVVANGRGVRARDGQRQDDDIAGGHDGEPRAKPPTPTPFEPGPFAAAAAPSPPSPRARRGSRRRSVRSGSNAVATGRRREVRVRGMPGTRARVSRAGGDQHRHGHSRDFERLSDQRQHATMRFRSRRRQTPDPPEAPPSPRARRAPSPPGASDRTKPPRFDRTRRSRRPSPSRRPRRRTPRAGDLTCSDPREPNGGADVPLLAERRSRTEHRGEEVRADPAPPLTADPDFFRESDARVAPRRIRRSFARRLRRRPKTCGTPSRSDPSPSERPSAFAPRRSASAADARSATTRNRSHSFARVSRSAVSGDADATISPTHDVVVAGAANCKRATSSARTPPPRTSTTRTPPFRR